MNLYHVFYQMPALEKEQMYAELEELAQSFVKSGLLRIEAEPKQNFVRFSLPTRGVHLVFSKRELYEKDLYNRTYKKLHRALTDSGIKSNIESQVNAEIQKLKDRLQKYVYVEDDLEVKIARILVQSTHPVTILMIMLEQVEVYVSYGHNIGEVMDIVSWSQAGTNSGMQSTDGNNVAVFVSCGGDPLLLDEVASDDGSGKKEDSTDKNHGDGKPALARMMAIAGQEIGHYSDIKRDNLGRQISRYSANFRGNKADEQVNLFRNTDMTNIGIYWDMLVKYGISYLMDIEKKIQFYRLSPSKVFSYYPTLLWMKIYRLIFILRVGRLNFWPLDDTKNKDYLAISLQALFADMLFNLEPEADVYKSPDKATEEAIACIEALARVPQQVNKWGHKTTSFLWRNLYKFYYHKVIPGCIAEYEKISGNKFSLYSENLHYYSFTEKISFKVTNFKEKLRSKLFKR